MTSADFSAFQARFAQSTYHTGEARKLFREGRLAEAERECQASLDAAPLYRGKKDHFPFVAVLLGQIYLKEGNYPQAIRWLSGGAKTTMVTSLNLDLAMAYLKNGQFEQAKQCYSDQDILKYRSEAGYLIRSDLPGTDTPENLEATILLARGQDAFSEACDNDALVDFLVAAQKAPHNALIALKCSNVLTEQKRFAESAAFLKTVSRYGRPAFKKLAVENLGNVRYFAAWHAAHDDKPTRPH